MKLGSTTYIHPDVERPVVRKPDLHLLPILVLSFLLNSLDHSDLGTAKTDRLENTLGMYGLQHNLALSLFYITYVGSGPLVAILGKIYGPHLVVPIRTLSFGLVTLLFVAIKNLAGPCVVRVLLGLVESGFLPIVIYYLTL